MAMIGIGWYPDSVPCLVDSLVSWVDRYLSLGYSYMDVNQCSLRVGYSFVYAI
jgi:hypothetical protein